MLKKLLKGFKSQRGYSKSVDNSSLMSTYNRLPVSFERGQGVRLWDQNGKEYIDALGGIAVSILGHQHDDFTQSVKTAADGVLHVSNLFEIPAQEALASKLCEITQMDKAFICNSGTEANEAAIKIARKHGHDQNIENPVIVTATHSFHGRSMAAVSATGNETVKKGFEPMLEGFIHVPFNDPVAVQNLADNKDIVAVMVEPIQGEAGVIPSSEGYLKGLRELCDQHGWLLIVDEIQTGIGRTGKWFAYMHEDIQPDILTSAKALGNGIPIGACAAKGKAANLMSPGTHGSTFGGNPFASKVAETVIDIIEQDNLVEQAEKIGCFLKKQLQQKLGTLGNVNSIRGKGLMIGIELEQVYPNLAQRFLDKGLVVNITGGGKVIRLLPSVLLTEKQAKHIAETIHDIVMTL